MWLTMPEYTYAGGDSSLENSAPKSNAGNTRRSPVAVGTFMLRRASYFSNSQYLRNSGNEMYCPEKSKPSKSAAAIAESSGDYLTSHVKD